jgi:hypothetical protein
MEKRLEDYLTEEKFNDFKLFIEQKVNLLELKTDRLNEETLDFMKSGLKKIDSIDWVALKKTYTDMEEQN